VITFDASLRYVVCIEGSAVASSNRYVVALGFVAWVLPDLLARVSVVDRRTGRVIQTREVVT
jgi:hypothetical protein